MALIGDANRPFILSPQKALLGGTRLNTHHDQLPG
jgi:hypothetical protein